MKISVNMLVGASPEPFLHYALQSVAWADEIIIVDTAKGLNPNLENLPVAAKIVKYEGEFNFSNARNFAIEHSSGDFIWRVDADEVYYDDAESVIRKLDFRTNIFSAKFYHFMIDAYHYQSIYSKNVLFSKEMRWENIVHEELIRSNNAIFRIPLYFCHFGYLRDSETILRHWKLYSNLVGDFHHYKGWDSTKLEKVLEERIPILKEFHFSFPEVMHDYKPERKLS